MSVNGGHAEPVIGRAFARPVGFAHLTIRFNFQTAVRCSSPAFVGHDDGGDVTHHSRGTKCPSDASFVSLDEKRAQGMPVRTAPAASCAKVESTRVSHHRYAATSRHSLRNGGTAYTCSPRCPGLLATVACQSSNKLDPSVGGSGPHDFAVRFELIRRRLSRPSRNVHRILHPTSVTIAIRPSCGCGTAAMYA
jgi:hypothetical protein